MSDAQFVCRWTGSITIPADGQYVFAAGADAGALLRIDGRMNGIYVINASIAVLWQLPCLCCHLLLECLDSMLAIGLQGQHVSTGHS